mgnify:FL=1
MTDAEGRFTIVTEKPIVCYLVGGDTDQKVKSVGSRFGIPMETDIALEFHLKESVALTHLPVSDEPVVYAVYGDPADFRFDPKHPPLIMDGGEELSAETLDTYLGLPEQKMIGAWMVKGPEALKGYGSGRRTECCRSGFRFILIRSLGVRPIHRCGIRRIWSFTWCGKGMSCQNSLSPAAMRT